jgi:hypothetical protein
VAKWQATQCAGRNSRQLGTCSAHRGWRCGQRVLNRQPEGIHRAGDLALEHDAPPGPHRRGQGQLIGRHQRLGIRMQRSLADGIRRPEFHEPPQVGDRDPIAHMGDHRQVVRDEHIGQAELALQIGEQIEHIAADRHVQRRDHLVADDQPWDEVSAPGRC